MIPLYTAAILSPLNIISVLPVQKELPYILESNAHPFYGFRGLKNQMRIRFMVESWILGKNDTAAVHAVRTIQYNHLLSYLLL
jgi:hypothetical protein